MKSKENSSRAWEEVKELVVWRRKTCNWEEGREGYEGEERRKDEEKNRGEKVDGHKVFSVTRDEMETSTYEERRREEEAKRKARRRRSRGKDRE